MLIYSSFCFNLVYLGLGIISSSLEFSSSSLDIVDLDIDFPSSYISSYLAPSMLRASSYSRSSLLS